jgi:hypothetical protein
LTWDTIAIKAYFQSLIRKHRCTIVVNMVESIHHPDDTTQTL